MSSSVAPTAIAPFYSTEELNKSIHLYEGAIEVSSEFGRSMGSGSIEHQWLPEPTVRLECIYEATQLLTKPSVQITLPGSTTPCKVNVTAMGLGVQGDKVYGTLTGLPDGLRWGVADKLRSVTFHIPNFSWFEGALVQDDAEEETSRPARAIVSVEEWMITIDALPDYSLKKEDELEASSGNAITHVGRIERKDGATFSIPQEAGTIFDALYLWLSFCRGSWVAPILAVGFDEAGNAIWKDWRQWNIRRCEPVQTWMNRQSATSLERSLPGFYAKYRNDLWSGPSRSAIAWHVECNRRASGTEPAIILVQTALELLAWVLLVEDKKIVSSKGFNDLPASDKMRLLLSFLKIRFEVPDSLPTLRKLSKDYNWADGPDCIVGVRNALVHPELKNRTKLEKLSSIAFYETWNLGMWFLDLVLLNLFDYSGIYRNRLMRECTYNEALESVPWNKQAATELNSKTVITPNI